MKLVILLLLTLIQVINSTKCYLRLNELCVSNGSDAGWELEIQLIYYNAKEDGNWYTLTNNEFIDVPKNGCTAIDRVVFVPDSGDLLFEMIENDVFSDEVYQILHSNACRADFVGKEYETDSGTFMFNFTKIR